ncbi:hypothetical protein Y032_0155g3057 [Ancylostoma ceylanicum]|uniref:UBC core domain-containing protein n=1 Tax=Ancylostoma ceylanicum TaxID=53326 RepID=A0A016SZP0_9BILA|nr:hypothetical protein Y032_0155g3057 [Ancylostoma ceylanicum]
MKKLLYVGILKHLFNLDCLRWGYERPEERWLPVHTVETILLSVISMLADPNFESPANVDAAKMQRENYAEFKKRVAACVRKSQEE